MPYIAILPPKKLIITEIIFIKKITSMVMNLLVGAILPLSLAPETNQGHQPQSLDLLQLP